ncbi:MAG: hypothetical protein KDA89_22790, partial [Planctomycetaceae bacterium]|nr:hypothetical protein [Planctomycetaceae bacterium]
KRHGLQGPIDDAFTEPFLAVTPTGTPQNAAHAEWVQFTLKRFQNEFDKWMRATVPAVSDAELTDSQIAEHNLILFGDPRSNAVLKRILPELPITWEDGVITVSDRRYAMDDHGLSMIFPNPLNRRRYVVINSGHTFHEKDFLASNAWLFPRLGDIAVQKFSGNADGSFTEETVRADNFNSGWQLARD